MSKIRMVAIALLLMVPGILWGQEEFRPAKVAYCSGRHFSFKANTPENPDFTYCINNAIDGNPDTYACILDDTPTGARNDTKPPQGSEPVTGFVVFDMGKTHTVYGLKITAPKNNCYVPKNIDLFCIDDEIEPESLKDLGKLTSNTKTKQVLSNYVFPYFSDGQSYVVPFQPAAGRYIVLKVNSAYDTGRMDYYIYQFSEISMLGSSTLPPDKIDQNKIMINGESLADFQTRDYEIGRRNIDPVTKSRLHRDWIYQDHGMKWQDCFCRSDSNDTEHKMVRKVLDELKEYEIDTAEQEKKLTGLVRDKVPGKDSRWSELYWQSCEIRRTQRLKIVPEFHDRFVFTKHYVMGGRGGTLAMTADLTDSEVGNHGPDWRVGSEMNLLSISPEGQVSMEVLLESKEGIIRDPSVSFDGDKIAFAMKKNADDDYHLYIMKVKDRSYQQITFGKATADFEPCFLQSGDLIFSSTRCDQSAPCWWSNVTNLYTCDEQGRFLRRLAFDQAHTFYPQVLDNGQVVFARWEYNDRGPIFNEPLFVMNPDGTSQTEYYGNNSWTPTTVLHARGIPGTSKVIALASGHHCDQVGKLMIIDRTRGTQEGKGIEYVAPERPFVPEIDDRFGCSGDVFQYPYALDEDNYLVSYFPEGGVNGRDRKYSIPFGIYWMNRAGRRELLVYDPTISSGQISPLAPREKSILKSTTVDLNKNEGTFFVQNVYIGPGLEGIPKGTVKKLRVVALEYRAVGTTHSYNKYYGQVTTPVSICNGSWDVKHVLGTVDVEEDGSAYFSVPPRTPVYFQLLDEKGYVVQTMRSWAMVMPGESFGCVGCHEDKNTNYFTKDQQLSLAMKKPPQKPQPFYLPGEEPVPERLAEFDDSQRKAWEYLSVNAPQGMDRPRGFSYVREIQPILDRHCVSCHDGQAESGGKSVPMNLLGNSRTYRWEDVWRPEFTFPSNKQYLYTQNGRDLNPGRDFTESYLNLTHFGLDNKLVNAFLAPSDPVMLKPYAYGSSKSELMEYLEPKHYNVQLSQWEKDRFSCWIDLCVPFCGSWMEANLWDKTVSYYMGRNRSELRGVYLYHEEKRLRHAQIEVAHLEKYKEFLQGKTDYTLKDFPVYDFGGIKEESEFIQQTKMNPKTKPIFGLAEGKDARGGSNAQGNPRRNLALNPKASIFSVRSWPFVSSNSFYQYKDEYAPRAIVDGRTGENDPWWRPNLRTDARIMIEFGRTVEIDEVAIQVKYRPGQKQTWKSANIVLSDGKKFPITLENKPGLQRFPIPKSRTESVTVTDLVQNFPLIDCGIVECEIWGTD